VQDLIDPAVRELGVLYCQVIVNEADDFSNFSIAVIEITTLLGSIEVPAGLKVLAAGLETRIRFLI